MTHTEVRISKAMDETWEPDPDIGGQMKVLYRHGLAEAGLSRFTEPLAQPIRWTLTAAETFYVLEGSARVEIAGGPTLEVGVGDMACIPAGSETTWPHDAVLGLLRPRMREAVPVGGRCGGRLHYRSRGGRQPIP